MDDARTLGEQLEAARLAAGAPSYRLLEREAIAALGPTAVSNTAISNYHHGKVTPEKAQLELMCFLANRYGVGLSVLSPTVAARWESARELVGSASRCITTPLVCAA